MAEHLAESGHAVPDHDLGALEAVGWTLGWDGDVLPELTLLGCRVVPVVCLREDVHRDRVASGDAPQLDSDLLAIWEWPEAAGAVPASPLSLTGILIRTRRWRRGLAVAHTWRGFGAAAVLTGPIGVDEACRLEFELPGVDLVSQPASGPNALTIGAASRKQNTRPTQNARPMGRRGPLRSRPGRGPLPGPGLVRP